MRALVVLVAGALLLGACTSGGAVGAPPGRQAAGPPWGPAGPPPDSSPSPGPSGLLLASSFERELCERPQPTSVECGFRIDGDVEAGPCDARTGEWCIRINRMSRSHMGVVTRLPLPEGHAFVGAAHRVPAIPEGAIQNPLGFVQLEQFSVTDGEVPGWVVEVRLYEDRRIGLALFRARDAALLTTWRAPVDEWFYLVVELSNGDDAVQRVWVYDAKDQLVEKRSVRLDTRVEWAHGRRTYQKLGGTVTTPVTFNTFADDWYVATAFLGPLHIGPDGQPLPSG